MLKMQPDTIKDGAPINSATPSSPRSYSTFNLSRRFYTTQPYGLIQPSACAELTKGDEYPYRHEMALRTYSLKAPLMSDVFIKKDSFFVPFQAILPNNWEKIVEQPNQGDDVNYLMDGVVSGAEMHSIVSSIVNSYPLYTHTQDEDRDPVLFSYLSDNFYSEGGLSIPVTFYEFVLKTCLFGELFFSDGALISQLGHKFTSLFKWYYDGSVNSSHGSPKSWDEFEQSLLERLSVQPATESNRVHALTVNFYDTYGGTAKTYYVVSDLSSNNFGESPRITFRHFLDLARQNFNFTITYVSPNISADSVNDILFESSDDGFDPKFEIVSASAWNEFVNFNDLSSYQICCAHFFSNDHVDYIYSANLYRQLIWFYVTKLVTASAQYFSYNGVSTQYDALSGQMFKLSFASRLWYSGAEAFFYQNNYLNALWSFRHSLRYVDYFTGARTQPLAVGDTSVSVNDGKIDVIDTIRKTNMARFLYWAERSKRKISSYLKELFPGGAPAPDFHDPQFLSHTGDNIKSIENQNTAGAQMEDANSITSNLFANSNRFEFTLTPDRPGWFIQLCYFDVPRAYATATDREKYHSNRFEYFNPYCQWNGSQPILRSELGIGSKDVPWAYTLNYMEYKQKYDVAAGGFVRYLPGFCFLADNNVGLPIHEHISPSYIRSWSTELDPFYISLTGYTPASYFHFIIKHVALVNAKRPMSYAPDLI